MIDEHGMDEPGLKEEITQLRAKLQILRTWIHDVDWRCLCQSLPEAREWFDDDGVPK